MSLPPTPAATEPAGTEPPANRQVVVVAGPTAVGKGSVVRVLRKRYPQLLVSVSATTRPPRPGEVDGVDYHFVSEAEFDDLVEQNQLLEWAAVHGTKRYGTLRQPVEEAISRGEQVLLELDVQGARQVRHSLPEAFQIFLLPPSWEELVRRLSARGTESEAERQRRLETAREEVLALDEFDARVVNYEIDETVDDVAQLMGLPVNTPECGGQRG